MTTPPISFDLQVQTLATAVRAQGIRQTAIRAACNPMVMSRFLKYPASVRAVNLYAIAAACDFELHLCAQPAANARVGGTTAIPSRRTRATSRTGADWSRIRSRKPTRK